MKISGEKGRIKGIRWSMGDKRKKHKRKGWSMGMWIKGRRVNGGGIQWDW
jgi:hypothetical protein